MRLGQQAAEQRRLAQAEAYFLAASETAGSCLQPQPFRALSLRALGDAYAKSGFPEKAIIAYRGAIDAGYSAPSAARVAAVEPLLSLARFYRGAGDASAATAEYERAFRLGLELIEEHPGMTEIRRTIDPLDVEYREFLLELGDAKAADATSARYSAVLHRADRKLQRRAEEAARSSPLPR